MQILKKSTLYQLMRIISQYPAIISFICAELFFLLTRSSEVTLVCKTKTQRNEQENSQVQNGLLRSLVLEAFLFIPASVTLFLLAVFPLILSILLQVNNEKSVWYGVMGIIGYGFPFIAVRRIVTQMAVKTLREFAVLTTEAESNGNKDQQKHDEVN